MGQMIGRVEDVERAVANLGAEATIEKIIDRAELHPWSRHQQPASLRRAHPHRGGSDDVGGRCAELKNHMTTNYLELRNHLEERLTQFGREMPGPMSGFARLHKKAVEDGALSAKVKELMALAISIAVGCEGCIAYHTHDAIQAGATRLIVRVRANYKPEALRVAAYTLIEPVHFVMERGMLPGIKQRAESADVATNRRSND